jgi:hypothetical protein
MSEMQAEAAGVKGARRLLSRIFRKLSLFENSHCRMAVHAKKVST